jgi:hypothetical protein
MGEIMRVDLKRLRGVADRVWDAACDISAIPLAGVHPDELSGSTVTDAASPASVIAELGDVVADMRGWALAARSSADALERADDEHGERIGG